MGRTKKLKAASIEQSQWGVEVCTNVKQPRGWKVTKIVLCEESKRGVHAGIHITIDLDQLPKGFSLDAILIYHGEKKERR